MPRVKLKKQIIWDARSNDDPIEHDFILIAIADSVQTRKIKQRALEEAGPTEEITEENRRFGTGNLYRIIKFKSHRKSIGDIPWAEIYSGPTRRDTNLCERDRKGILIQYLESQTYLAKLSI